LNLALSQTDINIDFFNLVKYQHFLGCRRQGHKYPRPSSHMYTDTEDLKLGSKYLDMVWLRGDLAYPRHPRNTAMNSQPKCSHLK
jgi:hypothetical protein